MPKPSLLAATTMAPRALDAPPPVDGKELVPRDCGPEDAPSDFSPEDAEARPPFWLDIPLGYQDAMPGLPSFVTPEWFRTHVRLTTTNLRRMRQGLERRRRIDPAFLPWWPDDIQPVHEDLFWFVARAGIDKRDSVSFSALLRKECRPGSGLKNASFFEPLFASYSQDRLGKPKSAPRRFGSDVNFAAAYERGAEAAAKMIASFMESDESEIPADYAAMVEWFSERFPECFEDAERLAAAHRAARIARNPPPQPKPEPEPEPVPDVRTEAPGGPAIDEVREMLAVAERERAALSADLDDLNTRHAELQRELAAVRAGFDPRLVDPTSESDDLPETVEGLVHWIETRLAPDVHVLPRAFRSLRKAPGFDVQRLARGLRFLRDVYVPYRSEGGMAFSAYKEAQVDAGFDESASFASSSSIEAFPEYKAVWNGRTIALDRHLKRGVGTDARTMLRVYFHWDRETRTVVVGHMPGHLDNWKKN